MSPFSYWSLVPEGSTVGQGRWEAVAALERQLHASRLMWAYSPLVHFLSHSGRLITLYWGNTWFLAKRSNYLNKSILTADMMQMRWDLEAEVLVGSPRCVPCIAMSSACASRSCTAPSGRAGCLKDTPVLLGCRYCWDSGGKKKKIIYRSQTPQERCSQSFANGWCRGKGGPHGLCAAVLAHPGTACSCPVTSQRHQKESGLCLCAPGKSLCSPFPLNICSSILPGSFKGWMVSVLRLEPWPRWQMTVTFCKLPNWQEPSSGSTGPGFSAAWMRKGEKTRS